MPLGIGSDLVCVGWVPFKWTCVLARIGEYVLSCHSRRVVHLESGICNVNLILHISCYSSLISNGNVADVFWSEQEISHNDCFLMFAFLQIKNDTKRAVYCALIRLLQDKDLSVRVCSISCIMSPCLFLCPFIIIYSWRLLYFAQSLSCVLLF